MQTRICATRKVYKASNIDLKADTSQNKNPQKVVVVQDGSQKDEYHDNTKPAIKLPRPSSSKKENAQTAQNDSRKNKFTTKPQPKIIELNKGNNLANKSLDPNLEKIIQSHVNVTTDSSANRQAFNEILRSPGADCHNHRLYVSSDCQQPRRQRVYVSKGVPLNQKLCINSMGDRAKKAFELFREKQMEVNLGQNSYVKDSEEKRTLVKNNSVYPVPGIRANKRFYNNLSQPNVIDLNVEPNKAFHKVSCHTLKPNLSTDFYRYKNNSYTVNRYSDSSERMENFDLPNEQKTYNDNSEVRTKTYQTSDGKYVTVTTTVTVSDRNPMFEPIFRTNERVFRRNKLPIKSGDPDLPKFINDIREKEFSQVLQKTENRYHSNDKNKTFTAETNTAVAPDKYNTEDGKIFIRRTVYRDPKNGNKKKERIDYGSGSKNVLSTSNIDKNHFNTSNVSQSIQSTNTVYKSSNKFQTYTNVNKFNKPTGTFKQLEVSKVVPPINNKSRMNNNCLKNYKKKEETSKPIESKAKNVAFFSSVETKNECLSAGGDVKKFKPFMNAYKNKRENTNKETLTQKANGAPEPKKTITYKPYVSKKIVTTKKELEKNELNETDNLVNIGADGLEKEGKLEESETNINTNTKVVVKENEGEGNIDTYEQWFYRNCDNNNIPVVKEVKKNEEKPKVTKRMPYKQWFILHCN